MERKNNCDKIKAKQIKNWERKTMHFMGVFIGMMAFIMIGIFHPIVIKTEYYFGKKVWPVFLVAGLVFIFIAIFTDLDFLSALLAILGFSCLWSIHELIEQEVRVERGWFPKNPNKKGKKNQKEDKESELEK